MSRLGLVLSPVAAAVGALLGLGLGGPLALTTAILFGLFVGVVVHVRLGRRMSRLAADVNARMGQLEHATIPVRGSNSWQQLGVAINALGASYARRGQRLATATPSARDLVGSLTSGALLFTEDGYLSAANARARELLGVPDPDAIAAELTVIQAVGSSALAGAVREARASGHPVRVDAQVGERELLAVASILGGDVLLMVSDSTRERRIETLRRDFVVNASHELKTPVTSIRTLSEALEVVAEQPDGYPRVVGLVRRLREESERLAALVHDLLDLRRLEERAPLEVVAVDVAEVVREVLAAVADEAGHLGLDVEARLPTRAVVGGEREEVALIVRNLVRNAVQYNHAGGRVEVEVQPAEGAVEISVTDNGLGIAQADVSRIFERFYRVDTARSRETGGTGLGLSIVRHAVERHGGSIRVTSLLGEGSTFTVRLPVEPRS